MAIKSSLLLVAYYSLSQPVSWQRKPDPAALPALEVGYNYRLSNVLAGLGRGQLRVLERRVADDVTRFTNRLWKTCQE